MIIRGCPQTIEYENASTPVAHITQDNQGRERKPDKFPTIEILNPAGTQLVAPATVKAELDFALAGCANLDSVVEATSEGDEWNNWTWEVAPAVAAAVTLNHALKTILVEYIDGVTTVANFITMVAGFRGDDDDTAQIRTAGTTANILAAPGDTLAATNMTGGVGAAMLRPMSNDLSASYFGEGLSEGFLRYNTQTAEFRDGAKVTEATSNATGFVRGQIREGTEGILHLGNVDGLFQGSKALTGSSGGVATSWGSLYTCEHFYMVDASTTATWPYGEGYLAVITWLIDGLTYRKRLYFDVGFAPMCRPFVSSQDIETIHPTWIKLRSKFWSDFGPAVRGGHGDLIRRIHAHGEKSSEYVKREEEFWRIELAFIEAWIAVNLGFKDEDQKRWLAHAESEWGQRGLLTKKTDDDTDADQTTIQARLLK